MHIKVFHRTRSVVSHSTHHLLTLAAASAQSTEPRRPCAYTQYAFNRTPPRPPIHRQPNPCARTRAHAPAALTRRPRACARAHTPRHVVETVDDDVAVLVLLGLLALLLLALLGLLIDRDGDRPRPARRRRRSPPHLRRASRRCGWSEQRALGGVGVHGRGGHGARLLGSVAAVAPIRSSKTSRRLVFDAVGHRPGRRSTAARPAASRASCASTKRVKAMDVS